MKAKHFSSWFALAAVPLLQAQAVPKPVPDARVEPPPPVSIVRSKPAPAPVPTYVYEQKPAAGRPYLVHPDQAQALIDRFREHYAKLGSPRVVIYVNRELVDQESGLKLSARRQQTEAGETEKATARNFYRITPRKSAPLADRQTVRDVERLFGRPLRMAGVKLADQSVATQLLSDNELTTRSVPTEGEQARKDREALARIADVVLEILISSREVTVSEVSGDRAYSVPDIQATAIRLSDSAILGQATASDLIGHGRHAGRVARNFDVREIVEANL